MANEAVQRVLDRLEQRGCNPKARGDGWRAICPAHDDSKPSLDIDAGQNGCALLICRSAGCSREDIVAALGLTMRDLFGDDRTSNGGPGHSKTQECTYSYQDEDGKLLYQVVRYRLQNGGKEFLQRRPDGAGGWIWKTKGIRRVLYRLPQLKAAAPGSIVLLVEGEKDCHTLEKHGFLATTNSGGAESRWLTDYSQQLAGLRVVVIPDNDDAGRKHAAEVLTSLRAAGVAAVRLDLAGLPPKGDVTDWINAGGTAEELQRLVDEVLARGPQDGDTAETDQAGGSEYERNENREGTEGDISFNSFLSYENRGREWPAPMAREAFHGLAGKVVSTILPHTEADPAALLITFLGMFGNVVGLGPHCQADGAIHRLRIFTALVGGTNEGRKGTSRARILPLFEWVDPLWHLNRQGTGVASGEGIIHAVRDRVTKKTTDKDGREAEDVVDEGVSDKRLFIAEAEFSGLLKTMRREGNIISDQVRQAWESDHLRRMTKNNPLSATGAHVSILGHIAPDELRRLLTDTETSNGFANRFLYICCKRSKSLPEGGGTVDYAELGREVSCAAMKAGALGLLQRDEEARHIWAAVYDYLVSDLPGLFGDITARRAPQVLRLSAIYAALDGWTVITAEHLLAALAVWDYASASAAWIFGDTIGDAAADTILDSLRRAPDGLSRTDISDLFMRNLKRADIERALGLLLKAGRVQCRKADSGGRPAEVWLAVHCDCGGADALLPKARAALCEFRATKKTKDTKKVDEPEEVKKAPDAGPRGSRAEQCADAETRVGDPFEDIPPEAPPRRGGRRLVI